MTTCWNCNAESSGAQFCPQCGKIQPLPRGTDYFAFFGLPQKLWMDSKALEAKFLELSWKLHPDNFAQASQRERELSLERASQLNDAYRTLREPVSRVEYLLALHGARKEGTTKQQAPPELLEEVFELNEALEELRSAPRVGNNGELAEMRARLEAEQHRFEGLLKEADGELMNVAHAWDAALDGAASGDSAKRAALMQKMNEILNRRSYIRNLVANVQKELAEA